jgi:tetratricopeptide (TPR) repeat protein
VESIFVGRAEQISQLEEWLQNPDQRLLINYHGVSGTGKSRLVEELARRFPDACIVIDFRRAHLLLREELLDTIAGQALSPDLLIRYQELKASLATADQEIEIDEQDALAYSSSYANNVAQVYIGSGAQIGGDVTAQVITQDRARRSRERRIEKRLQQLTEQLVSMLAGVCQVKPVVLLFDNFERLESKSQLAELETWVLDAFFSSKSPLVKVPFAALLFSREIINVGTDHAQPLHQLLPNLTQTECVEYLKKVNITSKETQDVIISLTKGHPYCLFLAADWFEKTNPDISAIEPELLPSDVEEQLIAKFLVAQIIESQTDDDTRNAFIQSGVFRFINASCLAFALSWPLPQAMAALDKLAKRSFIVRLHGTDLWAFHDILRDLLLAYLQDRLSQPEYASLHQTAIQYYKDLGEHHNLSLNEKLMCLVERLYHLLQFSEEQAWEYFEANYKPRLDRREKDICRILASQVEVSEFEDPLFEAWFRFRLADFWREFGEYDRALRVYNSLLEQWIPKHGIKDARLVASLLNNVGWTYLFHNPDQNNNRAIALFERVAEMTKEHGFRRIEAMALNNLGIAWGREPKGRRKAREFCRQSLRITESEEFSNDPSMQLVAGYSHQNLAMSHFGSRELSSAKNEYELASRRYQNAGTRHYVHVVFMLYGHVLLEERQFRKAYNAYRNTLKFWQASRDFLRLVDVLFHLGVCHENLGELDAMASAHAAVCTMSLLESTDYHTFSVTQRVVPFSYYLVVKRGKEATLQYLEDLLKQWHNEEFTSRLKGFEEFILEQCKMITAAQYFMLAGARTYHRLQCRLASKVRFNQGVSLAEDDKAFRKAKKRHCILCIRRRNS